jgi:nucleotide-binding universal stress UspA family protein
VTAEGDMMTDEERPILLCYDCTDSSRHAIEAAGALFRGRRAIVLHVYLPMRAMAAAPEGATWSEETIRQGALKLADDGVQAAVAAGFDAVPVVAPCGFHGVDHAILDAAAQYNAGLIVLGARASSTFPFPPGSVSHGVAQRTFLPILLVPATQFLAAGEARSATP